MYDFIPSQMVWHANKSWRKVALNRPCIVA